MSTIAAIRAETERQRRELEQRLAAAEQSAITDAGLAALCEEIARGVEAAETLARRAKKLQAERRDLAGSLRSQRQRRAELISRLLAEGVSVEALTPKTGLAAVQIRGLASESAAA